MNFLRDFLAITFGVVVGGWLLYFSVQAYEDHRSSKDAIMTQPEKLKSEWTMGNYTKAVLTAIAVCVFSQSVYAKRPDLTNTYFTCELYDSRAFIKGIDDNQAQIISEIGLDIMGINYIYRPQ